MTPAKLDIPTPETKNLLQACADLEPIGGTIRQSPEDFQVDEVPAYLPSGEGEHLFLLIRKRELNTDDVVTRLCQHLSVPSRDVGYAGQKDRHAVTTQWFSVTGAPDESLPGLETEGIELLEHARHSNKLRVGHLRGNRFAVVVRGVDPQESLPAAQAIVERLQATGLPNLYGPQRFGSAGDNHRVGREILLGRRREKRRSRRRFMVSAYQSALFNHYLAFRAGLGGLSRVMEGDLLKKHGSGGQFHCDDPATDQQRAEAFEISPTGPVFGHKMPLARGEPGEWEQALLDREELTLEQFRALKRDAQGARRHLLVPMEELRLEEVPGGLRLLFVLPPGAYATVVLRELTGEW